jgi:hypothetical protein
MHQQIRLDGQLPTCGAMILGVLSDRADVGLQRLSEGIGARLEAGGIRRK